MKIGKESGLNFVYNDAPTNMRTKKYQMNMQTKVQASFNLQVTGRKILHRKLIYQTHK